VEKRDRNSIWLLREQRSEVDIEVASVVILDDSLEGREGVDVSFFFAPATLSAKFLYFSTA
jgi:hypothetical protein